MEYLIQGRAVSIASVWRLTKVSSEFVAALYTAFGLGDLVFSLIAFQIGIPEGNPFLRWAYAHGGFVPVKLGLTALAAGLIGLLYGSNRARFVCWSGVATMGLVDAYHVLLLTGQLPVG